MAAGFTACTLKTEVRQRIEPETWTLLRFDQILRRDVPSMFRGRSLKDPQSALIYPDAHAYFLWAAMVHWDDIAAPPGQVQFLSRWIRDPYGLKDSTGGDDVIDTPGKDFERASWPFVGRPDQPVGVQVWHDFDEPADVVLAEHKALKIEYR